MEEGLYRWHIIIFSDLIPFIPVDGLFTTKTHRPSMLGNAGLTFERAFSNNIKTLTLGPLNAEGLKYRVE